jgi:hypothetical protein
MSQSGGVTVTSGAAGTGRTEVQATSGVVGAAAAVASLPAVAGKTTWLSGFEVTAAGSTAALAVDVTIAGPTTVMHHVFTFPAGVGVPANPLIVEFIEPVPAAAVNTAIVITCPSGGAGNVAACVSAHGFQI